VDADLDTPATALQVRTDDLSTASPDRAPARPAVGLAPRITDAEPVTLAVLPALPGRTSEARWLRPARAGETPRPGARLFRPLRQVIASINDTGKGRLDLDHHGGHTPTGVRARVLQRVLAPTAAIWHNDHIGAPTPRSLIASDH
jgi:hypothetical protein